MASSWSWVTCTKVRPTSVWIRLSSICICRRSLRSSAPSGSSSSSTAGRLTIARASATRCCCPPESCAGLRRAMPRRARPARGPPRPRVFTCLAAAPAQAERDVLEDVEVREQRVALEDGVDRPLVRLGVRDVLVADVDRPVGRLLEPGDHPQRGRLAAAGRAEQREERPGRDRQGQVVDRDEGAEALRDAFQPQVAARRLRRRSPSVADHLLERLAERWSPRPASGCGRP